MISPAHAGRAGPAVASQTSGAEPAVMRTYQAGASFQFINQIVPLGQVLDMINSVEPGVQLDTRLINENGRPYYIVRWQASRGRIMIFKVDAQSGAIVGRQG
jgi:uncharacterized membrane protein YkoI